MPPKFLLIGTFALMLASCGNTNESQFPQGGAGEFQQTSGRDQIKIVGSSTLYPFSTTVAEHFGRMTSYKTPIVESTGSGGGLKLFCSGIGANHPDITNASRRIKPSELALCKKNGITQIVEVKIGYDGIIIARSRTSERLPLTLKDIFLALARDIPNGEGSIKTNDYVTWQEVNPALPDVKIEVMGPPPTSGTRDAFVELAMEGGCDSFDWVKALKITNTERYKSLCHTIREDGHFIQAGENDNLIVQKLGANPDALGIFGFGFLDQNADTVQGSLIDGVEPTFANIFDGSYPVSRSLYFYVKKDNIGRVAGIEEFLAEFTSDRASGPEGYLSEKGLIPMDDAERAEWKIEVAALMTLTL